MEIKLKLTIIFIISMTDYQGGRCISFIIWLVVAIIVSSITKSVFLGIVIATVVILGIAYYLTKDS